jgi:hypothetical protein
MTSRPANALPKPWLFALLLLFGAALAAPAAGSVDRASRHATSSNTAAEAERAHRDVLRTAVHAVRAVQPKGSGGDLLPARSVQTFLDTSSMGLRSAESSSFVGQFARAFDARAPPFLTA